MSWHISFKSNKIKLYFRKKKNKWEITYSLKMNLNKNVAVPNKVALTGSTKLDLLLPSDLWHTCFKVRCAVRSEMIVCMRSYLIYCCLVSNFKQSGHSSLTSGINIFTQRTAFDGMFSVFQTILCKP